MNKIIRNEIRTFNNRIIFKCVYLDNCKRFNNLKIDIRIDNCILIILNETVKIIYFHDDIIQNEKTKMENDLKINTLNANETNKSHFLNVNQKSDNDKHIYDEVPFESTSLFHSCLRFKRF